MKKYLNLLIVLFIGVSLSSCDNDDDGGNTPAADPVVGTWQITQVNQTVEENGSVVFDETFSTDACNSDIFFTFVNGGQLTLTEFELDFDFDFNGNVSLDCQVYNNDLNGGWSLITGNTYSINVDGETNQVTITFSNNNNAFDLSFSFTETVDGDTFTESVTLSGNRV
mgnify:CR=1 FL=1